MGRVAAFFDIDGTIYRDGLITELFKKLVKHELIEQSKWFDEVRPAFKRWDRRLGDYDEYLMKMVDVFKEASLGLNKQHIEHIAKLVIKQKGDRVYQFTRKEIIKHKEKGNLIFAISGSPYELVSNMAKKYEFDGFRSTIYETDENGNYTGFVKPMWDSESKRVEILKLSEYYEIDLEKSFSYGDTMGDLQMFKLTGNPYAINPTKELIININKDPLVKKKINVIVERKDVIYHIDIKKISIE